MTAHAWMLLPSGQRLDLLDPHPCAWTDEDLVIRLSRTHRWCSDTRWKRPLSVAQHSLTVLAPAAGRIPLPTHPRRAAARAAVRRRGGPHQPQRACSAEAVAGRGLPAVAARRF